MIEERFSDGERRRLLALCMAAMPLDRLEPELVGLIAKLSGTDTMIVARRAYPSARRGQ